MKVYMLKDVENVGMAGQLVVVSDGYATNYLFPRKYAVQVTPEAVAVAVPLGVLQFVLSTFEQITDGGVEVFVTVAVQVFVQELVEFVTVTV